MKRTKQTARTHAIYTKVAADERFRERLCARQENVGVVMSVDDDASMTCMHVARDHASWVRVRLWIDSLEKTEQAYIGAFHALLEYVEDGCDTTEDKHLSTSVIVGDDERKAWTAKRGLWTSNLPRFTDADVLFMPSWA